LNEGKAVAEKTAFQGIFSLAKSKELATTST
jgi:hypothetical protein